MSRWMFASCKTRRMLPTSIDGFKNTRLVKSVWVRLRGVISNGAVRASIYGTQETLRYGALGNLQVDRAPGIGRCLALRTGCCFRRDSARDNPHPAVLRFPASVHLPLYVDRNRHHFLVRRNGSGSARSLALFFGSEPVGEEPFPSSGVPFGVLPYLLCGIQYVNELV